MQIYFVHYVYSFLTKMFARSFGAWYHVLEEISVSIFRTQVRFLEVLIHPEALTVDQTFVKTPKLKHT
jgi:hypothetical protein